MFAVVLFGCVRMEEVSFDGKVDKPVIYLEGTLYVDNSPHLNIESNDSSFILSPDTSVFDTAHIKVGRTLAWNEPKGLVPLPDAHCIATLGNNSPIELAYDDSTKSFRLPYREDELYPGDTLTITVEHPGFKTARATAVVPNSVGVRFGRTNQQYNYYEVETELYPVDSGAPTPPACLAMQTFTEYINSRGYINDNTTLTRSDDPFMQTAIEVAAAAQNQDGLQMYYGKQYYFDHTLDLTNIPSWPYTPTMGFYVDNDTGAMVEINVYEIRFYVNTHTIGYYHTQRSFFLGTGNNPFANPSSQYTNVENGAGLLDICIRNTILFHNPDTDFEPKEYDDYAPHYKGGGL